MNKSSAFLCPAVIAGLASALTLSACAGPPLIESYAPRPEASVLPPADAVQYFLPRRLVAVTVQRTRTHRDTIAVRVLAPVPDLAQVYYLRAPGSIWRDTSASLKTTASGLLTSISVASKDQTPAVLADTLSLAALVPELATLGGSALSVPPVGPPMAGRGRTVPPAPVPCGALGLGLPGASVEAPAAFKATVVFDPTSIADVTRAEAELCTRGARYRFVVLPVSAGGQTAGRPAAARAAARETCVYYRRDEPFLLTIYDAGPVADAGFTLVSAALIQLPNVAPIERLALRGAGAVATRASATFSDGMLLSSTASVPSEARAIASIPVDIAKAIVSIPSALFQFRIDSTRDAARLTEAQTEAIKAQTAQLNALSALRATRSRPASDASDSVSPSLDSTQDDDPASDEDRDVQH